MGLLNAMLGKDGPGADAQADQLAADVEDEAAELHRTVLDAAGRRVYTLDQARALVLAAQARQRAQTARPRRAMEWAKAEVGSWQRGRLYGVGDVLARVPQGIDRTEAAKALGTLVATSEIEAAGMADERVLALPRTIKFAPVSPVTLP